MTTKVPVFESESEQEITLIKNKLQNAGIEYFVENNFPSLTSPESTIHIMVALENEAKAFEIIDEWLQENGLV